MRKLLILASLLLATLTFGQFGPIPAQASGYCSVTCSGGVVLSCCLSSGTCTSTPGTSIDCNGILQDCAGADCRQTCENNFTNCQNRCQRPAICMMCEPAYQECLQNCGGAPNNIGC